MMTRAIQWGIAGLIVGLLLTATNSAVAQIVDPPDDPSCRCDPAATNWRNHGQYVSCIAHHKELWGPRGNSDAAHSNVGMPAQSNKNKSKNK